MVVHIHRFVAVRSLVPLPLTHPLAQADVHPGRVFHSAHSFLGRRPAPDASRPYQTTVQRKHIDTNTMKFTNTLASLALLLAGTAVEAAHISNIHHLKQAQVQHRRRSGASATWSSSTASATASATPTASSSSTAAAPTSSGGASGCSFSSGVKRGLSYNDASLTGQFTSSYVSAPRAPLA